MPKHRPGRLQGSKSRPRRPSSEGACHRASIGAAGQNGRSPCDARSRSRGCWRVRQDVRWPRYQDHWRTRAHTNECRKLARCPSGRIEPAVPMIRRYARRTSAASSSVPTLVVNTRPSSQVGPAAGRAGGHAVRGRSEPGVPWSGGTSWSWCPRRRGQIATGQRSAGRHRGRPGPTRARAALRFWHQ